MAYLERRRNLWYAVLTVPADVREKLGKLRFVQSLGTPLKNTAEREAAPLIAKLKAQIAEARGNADALTEEALRWQRHLDLQTQSAKGGSIPRSATHHQEQENRRQARRKLALYP
jgi:phosphoglycerate dehydrogenase-like enzyme